MLFQSNEKYELIRIPYARAGSYFFLIEDYFQRILKMNCIFSGDMTQVSDMSFFVKLLDGGTPRRYHYYGDEGSLRIINEKCYADIALTDEDRILLRGFKGAGVRFELASNVEGRGAAALDSAARLKNGSWEAMLGKHGAMRFRALRGSVEVEADYDYSKGGYSRFCVSFLPDAEGRFEAELLHYAERPDGTLEDKTFDRARQENLDSFREFFAHYTKIPERYKKLAEDSAYVTWSHVLRPGGYVKTPMILMHYNGICFAFSWQQSYNGMAMQGDPKEGFRLISNMFLYQTPANGALPGTVSPGAIGDASCQPALQGFALNLLVRRCGEDFITKEMAQELLPKFTRWIDYWTTYRSAGVGGDVTAINNPNESGWDDASIFKNGFPASNADTLALLTECMYACSMLARRAGDGALEKSWRERADRLLNTLITDYWDGEKFITRVHGEPVECMSYACYQPILLADRLPQYIIDKCAEKLTEEGQFLSPIGLCTENMNSPMCHWGFHFVLGRVVAPAQMFASVGLYLAGKKKEAKLIAGRWCDNVAQNGLRLGFRPYDEYPYNGEPAHTVIYPQIGDGWIWCGWSACNTMTMLQTVFGDEA